MKRSIISFIAGMLLILTACGRNDSRLAEGSFEFTSENYPVISVTSRELSRAVKITSAVLGIDASKAEEMTVFGGTADDSYKRLINGECDLVIAHGYSDSVSALLDESRMTLDMTEIDADALVFICESTNSVNSLTEEQLKGIYGGSVTDWSELGGEAMPISAFGEKDGTACRNAFNKYIADGMETITDEIRRIETAQGVFEARAEYDNRVGAIGYTLFSNFEKYPDSVKMLSVNGTLPDESSILSGNYPYSCPLYVAVRSSEDDASPVRILYNWICSEQGRKMMGGSPTAPGEENIPSQQ